LISSQEMSRVHHQFHGIPEPTDVLTFEYGEILLCPAVAEKEARARRLDPEEELLRYGIHGLLHLAGWRDSRERERKVMWALQEKILKTLLEEHP
jgi:probable rRNA maturation factor